MPLHIPTLGERVTELDIWTYAARTLTDPDSYKADYDTEMARITAARATLIDALGTPASFMADVSPLATPSNFMADVSALTTTPEATDEQSSFNWVTATHTTNEFDISSLFTTPLTGATRRAYSLFLDLTEAEADAAAWTSCIVKVKVEIDGSNYRTVDKKDIAKTDVASGEEPGVCIDIPATAKDCQVTLQFDVALNADITIYYSIVAKVLE